MLQAATGIMIFVACMVICLLKCTSGFTPTDCEPKGIAYHKLEVAEQMIKSAKEKFSNDMELCLPMDCEDVLKSGEKTSGIYLVWPRSRILAGPISVYCDMDTDGGGWTVIQRRGDFGRSQNYFCESWRAYKEGFGNVEEDFWLGNDKIYALTNQKLYSARFDLGDAEGNKRYAVYDTFWIDNEEHNYTLHNNGYKGDAGDSLEYHNGKKFSIKDRDNDISRDNFAAACTGGWWYSDSAPLSNLNGVYRPGKIENRTYFVIWYFWKRFNECLATTEIKIRRNPSWIK